MIEMNKPDARPSQLFALVTKLKFPLKAEDIMFDATTPGD
jgi:hypothetical protein